MDAYDSFSHNIVSLLEQSLGFDHVEVYMLHIDLSVPQTSHEADWQQSEFLDRLKTFDAVVCGPGPGNPTNPEHVGIARQLWQLQQDNILPVLGICLGFQSLLESLGGKVRRLRRGLHGMVRDIDHCQGDIFKGLGPFKATLYHSLCIDIGQDETPQEKWRQERWAFGTRLADRAIRDLIPLAWHDEEENGERILMAARHKSKPFWGLQYHPESICTEDAAHDVVRNWFREAMRWNESIGRRRAFQSEKGWYPVQTLPQISSQPFTSLFVDEFPQIIPSAEESHYSFTSLDLPAALDTAHVAEILGLNQDEAIILDSSSQINSDPLARSSIVAVDVKKALKFSHAVGDDHIVCHLAGGDNAAAQKTIKIPTRDSTKDIWDTLTDFWRRATDSLEGQIFAPCSFRGGFMGYVSYEMGLQGLTPSAVPLNRCHHPDVMYAWVTKSVVLDHITGKVYVQCIGKQNEGSSWLKETVTKLQGSHLWRNQRCLRQTIAAREAHKIRGGRTNEDLYAEVRSGVESMEFDIPDSEDYEAAVRTCQEYISAGDSYELCLTGETLMKRPKRSYSEMESCTTDQTCSACDESAGSQSAVDIANRSISSSSPWNMYQVLRSRQPAPFGSFIRLGDLTFLSCSPERFLRIDEDGNCSMRPMKGTVRKSKHVSTLAEAEALLHIPKEIAENLMIVDLVRHDLHGICGAGRVTVPELLKVEEYATVFTMITNVAAKLDRSHLSSGLDLHMEPFHGLHVLGSVLPPGSMTGAPKKRSCEILSKLENRERSVYSGVVGYFDITGQSDWSVTIRTMWKWDDENVVENDGRENEVWHVGAGGAVTILSTPDGEREEMLTKLCGPLGVFRDAA